MDTWAKFLPEVIKVGRAESADIRKITPPEADKAKIEQLTTREDKLIADFEKLSEIAAAGDEAEFQEVSQKVFPVNNESRRGPSRLRVPGVRLRGELG